MSYGEARSFLAKHTDLVELSDNAGARVAIAPAWQGRVMTSTCNGAEGLSFGFINRDFIEAGKPDAQFNNYGAEERMWLCPEGGPFSLWFKPGDEQALENWHTPPALNEGAWKVVSLQSGRQSEPRTWPGAASVRMKTHMRFKNASGAPFGLDVTREVRLLSMSDLSGMLGASAAKALDQPGVKRVAYETVNQIVNCGAALSKEKGLVSIWILGMMNAGPKTVVIAPYKSGPETAFGPVVKSDYFGRVPPERLAVAPEAVLFRADGNFRSKIGISQRRARNILGSIDVEAGVLTLVHFTMPDDPAKHLYLNNMWGIPQEEPYVGDVVNAYNDGPNDLGGRLGAFYEIESVSPARPLKTGESLTHRHCTIHIQADADTLDRIVQETLGIRLEAIRERLR